MSAVTAPVPAILMLDVRAEGGVAEAWLNDLPICRVGAAKGQLGRLPLRDVRPVHQFVVPGPNAMRLSTDGGTTRAIARLTWFQEGELADSDTGGRVVAEVVVPGPDMKDDASTTAGVATTAVELGAAFGVPRWQSASPLPLDAAVVDRAAAAVEEIAAALRAGSGDRFAALLATYLDGFARVYPGADRGELDLMHREYAVVVAKEAEVRIAPRDRWRPRTAGDGRLVDLRDETGAPVVTLCFPEHGDVEYPLLLGWCGDERVVLR